MQEMTHLHLLIPLYGLIVEMRVSFASFKII